MAACRLQTYYRWRRPNSWQNRVTACIHVFDNELTFQVKVIWQCTQVIDATVSTTMTANTAPADFVTAIL